MEGWELLPDGRLAVALCTGWETALAAPHAAAVRILFYRDVDAVQQGRQEAFQLAFTRAQLDDIGQALLNAGRELDELNSSSAQG